MSADKPRIHLPKSPFERARMPFTLALSPIWLSALLGTQARSFGSPAYVAVEQLGFVLIIAATLGRLWCTLYVGGRKDRELCTEGPYSLCRNPLYFFSFLGMCGVCLGAQNILLAMVSAGLFLLCYHFVMLFEEARLFAMFGPSFVYYCRHVPRFLPAIRMPTGARQLVVKLPPLFRALTNGAWFLLTIPAIEALEALRLVGLFPTLIVPF